MNGAPGNEPLQLRPLGLGEILDRAITLFVRNFPTFALIGLAYVIPLMIMQYFATASSAASFAQLLEQIQHPGRVPAAGMSAFPWNWIIASFAFTLVCSPFVNVAYASAVARAYRGSTLDWRECYATGLRRAGSILLNTFLSLVLFIFVTFGAAVIFGIFFGVLAVTVRGAPVLGVVLAVIAIAGTLAFCFLLGVLYLALAFSIYGIAIEDLRLHEALSRGFARIFTRTEIGKALLICLAFFAVYLGNFLVSAGLSLLLNGVVRVHLLDTVAQGILDLCFFGFLATLLAVYYFDVRVRREGLDIQRVLDDLDASSVT